MPGFVLFKNFIRAKADPAFEDETQFQLQSLVVGDDQGINNFIIWISCNDVMYPRDLYFLSLTTQD